MDDVGGFAGGREDKDCAFGGIAGVSSLLPPVGAAVAAAQSTVMVVFVQRVDEDARQSALAHTCETDRITSTVGILSSSTAPPLVR